MRKSKSDCVLTVRFVNCSLVSDNNENGLVNAQVVYKNEQCQFNFTQLVAMFLSKVKEFTTLELKEQVLHNLTR
jgi:hypothetical protein